MLNLFFAFILTLVLALVWLRIIDFFAHKGYISSQLSRKIIHIGTGPIFVLCWLFFPENPWSRYVAAIVPFLISVQFFLVGIGKIKDEASVEALSRSGDPREILKGPLIYGIVFVVLTILFWKDHPIGIIGLMILCGGDGLADVVGRRMQSIPIPWAKNKTLAGSIAMLIGSVLFSYLVLLVFIRNSIFDYNLGYLGTVILILGLIATFVETIPIKELDNLTVPVAVVLIGLLIL